MSDILASDSTYTEDQRALLNRLCDLMIPAGEDRPSAADPELFKDILSRLSPHESVLKPALAILAMLTLEKLAASEQVTLINQYRQAYPAFFQIFESQVIQVYYANSVVLTSLGVNAPSPYPGGYDVEETDWSLLDPVRGREPFYRILESGE
ncbi:MAG: hypothetical protein VCA12_19340 [Pseudomonadales bacterium]